MTSLRRPLIGARWTIHAITASGEKESLGPSTCQEIKGTTAGAVRKGRSREHEEEKMMMRAKSDGDKGGKWSVVKIMRCVSENMNGKETKLVDGEKVLLAFWKLFL